MTIPAVEGVEAERRDYPSLYARLCDCGGTQPSRTDPKLDLHEGWCRYRREVEGDGDSG